MSLEHEEISATNEQRRVRHVFDGIEEEDNDLPRWWLNMFYITIVFSFAYMAWYHWPIGKGATQEDEFAAEMAAIQEQTAVEKAKGFDYTTAMQDQKFLDEGAATYAMMCTPCHGERGQGGVGPNLTDEFWIVEPSFAAVEHIIATGSLEKGMPAWEPVIGHDKVRQLVAYIRTFQGTNVEGGKEPQGNPGKLP